MRGTQRRGAEWEEWKRNKNESQAWDTSAHQESKTPKGHTTGKAKDIITWDKPLQPDDHPNTQWLYQRHQAQATLRVVNFDNHHMDV